MSDDSSTDGDGGEPIEADLRDPRGVATMLPHNGSTWKVLGELAAASGAGVVGHNTATSGSGAGVHGVSDSPYGYGVRGDHPNDSGDASGAGVVGTTDSTGGATGTVAYFPTYATGVVGQANATSGVVNTAGVRGLNRSSSGQGYGVIGSTTSTDPNAAAVDARAANGATGVRATANSGVGLEVSGVVFGKTNDPTAHSARIETTEGGGYSKVLALQTGTTGDPTTDDNFATFFNGDGTPVGSIHGDGAGGVTFNSGGADYAEYLPRRDADETLDPGDVVGVVDGEVTRRTANADQALVVSEQPIVSGNAPDNPGEAVDHELVSFVGQVPVKVRGAVSAGDLVVPSGAADGTARAVAPAAWSPDDVPVVGRAWEGSDGEGVSEVTVAVGLETGAALAPELVRQRDRVADLEAENERLRERNADLESRLAAVESHLGLDADTPPAPADD